MARGDHTLPADDGRIWRWKCGVAGENVQEIRVRYGDGSEAFELTSHAGAWVAGLRFPPGHDGGWLEGVDGTGTVVSRISFHLSSWP